MPTSKPTVDAMRSQLESTAIPQESPPVVGQPMALIDRVVDLLDPAGNVLIGTTLEQARSAVRSGNVEAVRQIGGQFAILEQSGKTLRMARSIGRPMRYFLAKRAEGPALIVAERMDEIADQLKKEGLFDQFRPAYTRMVPAHHLLELQLVGCPDPNPKLHRFFAPPRNRLPADIDEIGRAYIGRLAEAIDGWLDNLPSDEPIGVMFSGGVDSGAVLMVLDFLVRRRGQSPSRIKAFTLSLQDDSSDPRQAAEFLKQVDREMFLEVVSVPAASVSWQDAVRVIEDYKPLDVQSATMGLALLKEVRRRYPDWIHMIDGDGGDENLKDYPIEENPELTIRSVLGNRMLYQEGWGVDAVKHSLTYSGGQSRGHVRTAPGNVARIPRLQPLRGPRCDRSGRGDPVRRADGLESRKTLRTERPSRGIGSSPDHRHGNASVPETAISARGGRREDLRRHVPSIGSRIPPGVRRTICLISSSMMSRRP